MLDLLLVEWVTEMKPRSNSLRIIHNWVVSASSGWCTGRCWFTVAHSCRPSGHEVVFDHNPLRLHNNSKVQICIQEPEPQVKIGQWDFLNPGTNQKWWTSGNSLEVNPFIAGLLTVCKIPSEHFIFQIAPCFIYLFFLWYTVGVLQLLDRCHRNF
jgi:hypothetical protein